MRFVERQQRLKKLTRRRYSTIISRAELTTKAGGVEYLDFAPGLSVIVGGNGAGKSTILGTIWRCLSGPSLAGGEDTPGFPPWLNSVAITGTSDATEWHAQLHVGDIDSGTTSFAKQVLYIDPASETHNILGQFRADMQPEDLLEGVDPYPFTRDQLNVLSHVLRREYDEVLVYEITAYSEDDTPVPYFRVTSMGQQYSLEQMGRGELATAYLLWKLAAVSVGSVVLIEEPESHLAAFSQDGLVDAIIASTVDQDLCLVVS